MSFHVNDDVLLILAPTRKKVELVNSKLHYQAVSMALVCKNRLTTMWSETPEGSHFWINFVNITSEKPIGE